MMMKAFSVLAVAIACLSTSADAFSLCPSQKLQEPFDLTTYQGNWYEVANTIIQRQTFQKNCQCTVARYSIQPDNTVRVNNVCLDTSKTAVNSIVGSASIAISADKPAFKVTFGDAGGSPDFLYKGGANYLVLKRDTDPATGAEYAIVGSPCNLYAWILSRVPSISDEAYESAKKFLNGRFYFTPLLRLQKVNQDREFCKIVTEFIENNDSGSAAAAQGTSSLRRM